MNSLLWISLYSFYWNLEINYYELTNESCERTKSDTEEKSLKFLLEIMILVSFWNRIYSQGKVIYVHYEQHVSSAVPTCNEEVFWQTFVVNGGKMLLQKPVDLLSIIMD